MTMEQQEVEIISIEEEMRQALQKKDMDAFREYYFDLHPYEQAMFFRKLTDEERMSVYTFLTPRELSFVMENIELEETEKFITEMDPHFAAMVLAEIAVDDAVDILKELTIDQVASFLALMEQEAADEIKTLLHYEEKTAGSIMTTEFLSVVNTQTVKETLQFLKEKAPDAETIYYTYVLDENKRLVGVLSLRDLIIADEDAVIADIMSDNVVSVSVGKDQEEVAQMIRDYDFLALPVVDFQNHLLGIITVDDILDVMDEEASDDYSKFAGMADVDRRHLTPLQAAKERLPWLIILLFLGMITASLIGGFEATLEEVPIVAIFIPLIAGMAGNAGTQSLAVAVRGLAVGVYDDENRVRLFFREITTGALVGLANGAIVVPLIYFWKGTLFLGVLVGVAIFVTVTIASLSGSLIPLLMEKLKIDPAVASGPFITTLNDMTSILIYFGMATIFMRMLI